MIEEKIRIKNQKFIQVEEENGEILRRQIDNLSIILIDYIQDKVELDIFEASDHFIFF